MSLEKNEMNNDIALLKRRATTYIKENGFQICEGLSQQPLWNIHWRRKVSLSLFFPMFLRFGEVFSYLIIAKTLTD